MRIFNKKTLLFVLLILLFGWGYFLHTGIAQDSPAKGKVAVKQTEAPVPLSSKPELVGSSLGLEGKLGNLIAQTPKCTAELKKGCINPDASKGYLGIPGAKKPNFILGLIWAIWVGWIFSTVGAFGGIMAGVGHITIFGLGNYAKSFKKNQFGSK